MLVLVAFAMAMVWTLHDLPLSTVLEPPSEPIIVVEAADGSELGRKGPVRDPPATRQDIPQHLVDAVLAIEDRRFYDHRGIDPAGILRALVRNLRAGEIAEGGSTITQQLVKLRLGDDERTLKRKIREAAAALWLERRLSKGEILTQYLNTAYFGAGATGISAAARVYFDKPVSELSLEDSALLAGLITAPSRLNPLRNPDAAQERARVVLDAMIASRRLDGLRAEAAKERPAQLNTARMESSPATWFGDWIQGEAAQITRSGEACGAGVVRVRTTLDPRLQALAEEIVSTALDELAEPNGAIQAALVAMRPDGAVVAMVGGRSYQDSEFNRAVQAMRQPASTFKLFVYFAALRNGYALDQTIEDSPLEIDGWTAENFGKQYYGEVSLADAFARSLNAATVRLAQAVGLDQVIEAARFLGLDAPLTANPSLALGTSEVSLIDLTGAYASVLAGIAPVVPTGIAACGGLDQQRLWVPGPHASPRQSLAPYHRSLVELLKGVVDHGTGRAAALDGFAAGKTGTSENNRDAWFVGFTQDLVAGVWVGNDDGEPMHDMTGGKLPASIWKAFMSEASRILGHEPPPAEPGGDELVRAFGADDGSRRRGQDSRADAPVIGDLAGQTGNFIERHPEPLGEASDQDGEPFSMPAFDVQEPEPGHAEPSAPARALALDSNPPEAAAGLTLQCDYRACSRAYRSFRRSDCTFQPYRGPRKLCLRGDPVVLAPEGVDQQAVLEFLEQELGVEGLRIGGSGEAAPSSGPRCNYNACSRAYRSFRPSDCTFQPYRGSRRMCRK